MFKDIELSKDIMQSFKQHQRSVQGGDAIDMTVNILTMGHWPTYDAVNLTLPDEVPTYVVLLF